MSLSRQHAVLTAPRLLDYAFFDRGFAIIGVASVNIGEFVVAIGLLIVRFGGFCSAFFRLPIAAAAPIYVAWRGLPSAPVSGVMDFRPCSAA